MSPLKTKLKGFAAAGLALSSALGLVVGPNTFAEGASSFFDANAAQCVVDNYNTTTGSSVTVIEDVDFSKVTTLNCANRNITHFRGITLFPNLEILNLENNTNLEINFMDFSQNTKLKVLNLYNAGQYYNLDLSSNPQINELHIRSISAATPYITFAKGVEKLGDNEYGVDFGQFGWWINRAAGTSSQYSVSAYMSLYTFESNKMIFEDKSQIPYSVTVSTPYGAFSLRTRSGYMNYRIFFEGDEEIETHNPININNNCEVYEDNYAGTYYSCDNTVYDGDEIDSDATKADLLEKIFNLSAYELSEVKIVPPTTNVELSIDTDTQKKGTVLADASFSLEFHFTLKKDTPKTPNTGLFTKEDGSANVENILLSLAGLSIAVFLILGVSHRLSLKSRTRKF